MEKLDSLISSDPSFGTKRVRDLFDSMYKGFPVGYLLFWATGATVGTKKIGIDAKQSAPSLLIVDGQQRLTSLFAVITGTEIVREDYSKARIRVAFKPSEERFEVADAATDNDPEFIADISEVFDKGFLAFLTSFIARLERHRGEPLEEEEKVADVFVRINSEGVKLST